MVKSYEVEFAFATDEVVRDENSTNRSEQCAVTDKPVDVAVGILHKFPRHDENSDNAGDVAAHAEGNFLRREMREIVGRADDVCGDVRGERGDAERNHRRDQHGVAIETRQHIHWIP